MKSLFPSLVIAVPLAGIWGWYQPQWFSFPLWLVTTVAGGGLIGFTVATAVSWVMDE